MQVICTNVIVLLCLEYFSYIVSKIGVTRLAGIHAETLVNDPDRPGILVNAVSRTGWMICDRK